MQPNDELSEATQRVLDIAERLFMESGFAAVTLRDVAETAGMRQASLYYHFPEGKEQLYVVVVERVFERHRVGMEEAVAAVPPRLRDQLQAVADWFGSQPSINFLGMMYADLPALGQANARRVAQSAYRAMFGPLHTLFAGAMARGEARPINVDLMAGFYIALLDGITFSLTQQNHLPRAALTQEAVKLLLYGIGAGPEQAVSQVAESAGQAR
jgi:AcrR family transcriptional regulator